MYQGLLGTFPFTVTELEVSTFRDPNFRVNRFTPSIGCWPASPVCSTWAVTSTRYR